MKFDSFFIYINKSLKISCTSQKIGICFYTKSKSKLLQLPNELSYTFDLVLF